MTFCLDISSWQSALLNGLLQLPNLNKGVQIASQQEAWCVAGPRGLSLHTQGIIYYLKDPMTKVLHSNMDSLSPCHTVRLWRLLVSNLCQMRTQMQSWGRIPMVTKLVTFFFLTFKPILLQVLGPSRDVIQAQRGAALEGNQWLRSL